MCKKVNIRVGNRFMHYTNKSESPEDSMIPGDFLLSEMCSCFRSLRFVFNWIVYKICKKTGTDKSIYDWGMDFAFCKISLSRQFQIVFCFSSTYMKDFAKS